MTSCERLRGTLLYRNAWDDSALHLLLLIAGLQKTWSHCLAAMENAGLGSIRRSLTAAALQVQATVQTTLPASPGGSGYQTWYPFRLSQGEQTPGKHSLLQTAKWRV